MVAASKMSIVSPEGAKYISNLLQSAIPHPFHDYILEGLCKGLAGTHVLSALRTGGGKTSYMYGFMKVLELLSKLPDSEPCPFDLQQFPKNPLMVAVFPTKGLEEDMAKTFCKYGINALAINEDTLAESPDLWTKAASPELSVLILSPEQFSSKPFDNLLHNPTVRPRFVSLGIDELHLILDWGAPGFRECYRDVGLGLARMPEGVVMFGVTATLPAGQETQQIIDILGLKAGEFFFSRRSNTRRDIRLIVRELRHGLGGWSFPDLRWIVAGKRKTIVYCDTISLAFRLFVDLWYTVPNADSESRKSRFRLYCSLFTKAYNEETRVLFINDPDLQIIFSTDALKVGNDFPNVDDVIVLNPSNPNDLLQKIGRAGRNPALVSEPRGIIYVTKAMLTRARDILEGKSPPQRSKKKPGRSGDGNMTTEMARFLLADCYIKELDLQYANPVDETPCTCATCKSTPRPHPTICTCSRCMPEPPLPPLRRKARKTSHVGYIPKARQLDAAMKLKGREHLERLRRRHWLACQSAAGQHLPPSAFLPDSLITDLLNNFHHLTTLTQLLRFIDGYKWAVAHAQDILREILELEKEFWKTSVDNLVDATEKSTGDVSPRRRAQVIIEDPANRASYASFWTNMSRHPAVSAAMSSQVIGPSPADVLRPAAINPSDRMATAAQPVRAVLQNIPLPESPSVSRSARQSNPASPVKAQLSASPTKLTTKKRRATITQAPDLPGPPSPRRLRRGTRAKPSNVAIASNAEVKARPKPRRLLKTSQATQNGKENQT